MGGGAEPRLASGRARNRGMDTGSNLQRDPSNKGANKEQPLSFKIELLVEAA